jgi:uncharacterized membrane protein YoaK (UPF0700 family)
LTAAGPAPTAPAAPKPAAAGPHGLARLVALPSVLGFVAGFVDTATFIEMHGLFVAHVTGNFVLLGATLAGSPIDGEHAGSATLQLASFPVFFLAAMAAAVLAGVLPAARRTQLLVSLAAVLVGVGGAAGFLAGSHPAVAMVLVVAMGVLNAAHRMDGRLGSPFTVMTGNVTALAIGLAHTLHLAPREREGPVQAVPAALVVVVLTFAAGCALGALVQPYLGLGAMLVPAAVLGLRLVVGAGSPQ